MGSEPSAFMTTTFAYRGSVIKWRPAGTGSNDQTRSLPSVGRAGVGEGTSVGVGLGVRVWPGVGESVAVCVGAGVAVGVRPGVTVREGVTPGRATRVGSQMGRSPSVSKRVGLRISPRHIGTAVALPSSSRSREIRHASWSVATCCAPLPSASNPQGAHPALSRDLRTCGDPGPLSHRMPSIVIISPWCYHPCPDHSMPSNS